MVLLAREKTNKGLRIGLGKGGRTSQTINTFAFIHTCMRMSSCSVCSPIVKVRCHEGHTARSYQANLPFFSQSIPFAVSTKQESYELLIFYSLA